VKTRAGGGTDPSPVPRRLVKTPSWDTLSPGERAAYLLWTPAVRRKIWETFSPEGEGHEVFGFAAQSPCFWDSAASPWVMRREEPQTFKSRFAQPGSEQFWGECHSHRHNNRAPGGGAALAPCSSHAALYALAGELGGSCAASDRCGLGSSQLGTTRTQPAAGSARRPGPSNVARSGHGHMRRRWRQCTQ
jgi:hypothetical protein